MEDRTFIEEQYDALEDRTFIEEQYDALEDRTFIEEQYDALEDRTFIEEQYDALEDRTFIEEQYDALEDRTFIEEQYDALEDRTFVEKQYDALEDRTFIEEQYDALEDRTFIEEQYDALEDRTFIEEQYDALEDRTFIEEQYDALKDLHEAHVVVAVLLHLLDECDLGAAARREGGQERGIGPQVFKGLLCYQLLFLVPLDGIDQAVPRLKERTQHAPETDTVNATRTHGSENLRENPIMNFQNARIIILFRLISSLRQSEDISSKPKSHHNQSSSAHTCFWHEAKHNRMVTLSRGQIKFSDFSRIWSTFSKIPYFSVSGKSNPFSRLAKLYS